MKTIIYLSVLAIIAFLYVRDVKLLFVTSNSMAPTIVAGDVIITCKSPYSDGSIITFRQRDVLVTHRLVSKGRMRTKGDSNLYEDPLKLYKEQIVGKACVIVPSGKILKITHELVTHYTRKGVKQ
ncbi:signal peptidase I [Candidatus Woesebacteria bacterium]|nr:signal peptidase I [Candidatus Woesebacteria bacterium]